MPQIDDVPSSVTGAGQDHNYTLPPVKSSLVLVSAPLSPQHRGLPSPAVYDAYIDAEVAANRAYTAPDGLVVYDPTYTIPLPISLSAASGFNYGRLTIDGRKWYIFYSAAYGGNPNTTVMVPTIDSWVSYGPWSLGYSMVNRGHAAVAASQSDTYGDQYCLTPEPISAPPVRGVLAESVLSSDPDGWTVLVVSANDLRGFATATPYFELHAENDQIVNAVTYGSDASKDFAGVPQFGPEVFAVLYPWQKPYPGSLEVYVPVVKPAINSTIDGVSAGGGVYLFTMAGFSAWLSVMQGASWVTEGIVDIRLVPAWAVSGGGSGAGISDQPPKSATDTAWAAAAAIPQYRAAVTTEQYDTTVLAGWRETYLASVGGGLFRKLITSAHTAVVVGNGESMTSYDPENMQSSGVPTHTTTGAAHGENSMRLAVDYNQLGDQIGSTVGIGGTAGSLASGYGRAASNTAAADLGPVNSSYSNFASREAMRRNQALAVELAVTKVPMNMGIIGVQSVLQAGQGAIMGAMVGSAPGAIAGAVLGGGAALVTAGVSANSSIDLLDASNEGSISIGAYQLGAGGAFNAMSFRAWLQGLKAVSGRGSAERLASAWRAVTGQAFRVIVTAPAPDRVRELLSTWRRYGYMIGRAFTPPRLDAMSKFTYWETAGAQVRGAVPADARAEIEAAFDAGVTVWANIGEIGTDQTSANTPTPGFTY